MSTRPKLDLNRAMNAIPAKSQLIHRPVVVRPNCTHISMDMIYSSSICNVCGKTPSMGWLYECQQDRMQSYFVRDIQNKKANQVIETFHIRDLKVLDFSQSVIEQARSGDFTDHQLEILKTQKIGVKAVIATHLHVQFPGTEVDERDPQSEMHPNVTVRKKKNATNKKLETIPAKHSNAVMDARCSLKCCHNCRPYYRDRVFSSMDAIAQDIDIAFERTPIFGVKLLNPAVVRILGMKEIPLVTHRLAHHDAESQCTTTSSFSSTSGTTSDRTPASPIEPGVDVESHDNAQRGRKQLQLMPSSGLPVSASAKRIEQPMLVSDVTSSPKRSRSSLMGRTNSSFTDLVGKLRNITRSSSQKVMSRDLSLPAWAVTNWSKATMSSRPHSKLGERHGDPVTEGIDASKSASMTDNGPRLEKISDISTATDSPPEGNLNGGSQCGISLSEIAVEEHVPDIITQV